MWPSHPRTPPAPQPAAPSARSCPFAALHCVLGAQPPFLRPLLRCFWRSLTGSHPCPQPSPSPSPPAFLCSMSALTPAAAVLSLPTEWSAGPGRAAQCCVPPLDEGLARGRLGVPVSDSCICSSFLWVVVGVSHMPALPLPLLTHCWLMQRPGGQALGVSSGAEGSLRILAPPPLAG